MPLSYSPLTLAASGTTFAQFQAGGLRAILENLIAANPGLTGGQISRIRAGHVRKVEQVHGAAALEISNFCRGLPVDLPDALARIVDFSAVFHAIAQALDEAGAVVAANPGSLHYLTQGNATATQYRSWP